MPKCMKCMEEYEKLDFCPYCGRKRDATAAYENQIPNETILNQRYIIGDAIRKDRIGFLYMAWDALLEQKVFIREWFPVRISRRNTELLVASECSKQIWNRMVKSFCMQMDNLHRHQDVTQLLSIYRYFCENNSAYAVMEYVEGMTLRDLLRRKNPLNLVESENIMEKLKNAVKELHRNSIVHGNITPDNIFLCQDGDIKLLDPIWTDSIMDKIKNTLFWSRYVPAYYKEVPLSLSEEIDEYSMAAVFYRLLSGEEPYGVMSPEMEEKLPFISEYGIAVSKQTEKEIMEKLRENNKSKKGFLSFLHI